MVKTEEDITKLIKFFKKEKYVVLFLYLMHYPSHAYSISLTFKRIKRSKLIDLSNKSKVSKFLSEMEKLKVVRHMQQGRKKMYMINPWFIKEQIFFPSNYTELGTSEQKMPKAQELIINFLNFIEEFSEEEKKEKFLNCLDDFKKLDLLSIIIYIYDLLNLVQRGCSKSSFKPGSNIDEDYLKVVEQCIEKDKDAIRTTKPFQQLKKIDSRKFNKIFVNKKFIQPEIEEVFVFLRDFVFSIAMIERMHSIKDIKIKKKAYSFKKN